MAANKHIGKIVSVVMAICICLCLLAMMSPTLLVTALGDTGISMEYETKLFDTDEVLNINIIMEDGQWEEMLASASSEEYYPCDVEINGQQFYQVGIRPKGNTSLSSIASNPDTDRYSLKLEFDHYVDGQTCYGLDKLILNNNYADATNMKEALIYDMFQYLKADASLYNFASICVNNEYWGVYLALEAVEDSFLLRNYGVQNGALYKPDSMNFGDMGGGRGDFGGKMPESFEIPDPAEESGGPDLSGVAFEGSSVNMPDMGDMDFSAMGMDRGSSMSGGANLSYIDDDLDSYSTIWDCEVTSTSEADHQRVVTALKNIAEGTELEQYMDVDNLLKYMAVHVFSVNSDSLSGSMAHNYYLYESNGCLNLLPWDYNLALGGMGGGSDATSVVNDAIDEAFPATDFFDTLMADEKYHARYYAYLQQLVDEYLAGNGFEAFYTHTRDQIDELVQQDPNALYSYEEYQAAAQTLYEVVKLRGESIDGQLNGQIPSTAQTQRNSDALIDASHLNLSAMGSMNTGGGLGFDRTDMNNSFFGEGGSDVPAGGFSQGGMPGTDQSGSTDPATDSTLPENFTSAQSSGQMPSQSSGEAPEGFTTPESDANAAPEDPQSGGNWGGGQMQERPDMGNVPDMFGGSSSSVSNGDTLLLYGVSLATLLAALMFAALYRRKPRKR